LFLAINHCVDIVRGEINTVSVCYGVGGACLDAIAAKNAARIVNVVDAGVALSRGNALRVSVFRSFDVNTIRRASSGAQEAAYAFLESVFVALQDVDTTIAGLDAGRNVRIAFRRRLLKHCAKRDAEAFHERHEYFADFSYDRCHESLTLANIRVRRFCHFCG